MKQLSVLIIEDCIFSADLNIRQLKKAGFEPRYEIVDTKDAMKEALLCSKHWDLIISDNSIPGFSALQALELRNEIGKTIKFVIVSEQITQKELDKAFENNCNGYVPKSDLSLLRQFIHHEVE